MRYPLVVLFACVILLTACTPSEPGPSATAVPATEPTPATQISPTIVPTAVLLPTDTPAHQPTAVSLKTFTSERFQFSAGYPSDWSLDIVSPQRIEMDDSLGTAGLTIDFRIFRTPVGLDAHNIQILDTLNEVLMDFEVTSSEKLGDRIDSTYAFTHPLTSRHWKGRMSTYMRGRLGIAITVEVREGAFDRHQPIIETLLASVELPGPDFIPPLPEIEEIAVATGVDEVDGDPIGAGLEFQFPIGLLFVIGKFQHIPVNSDMGFAMTRIDVSGEEIAVLGRQSLSLEGSGFAWGSFEMPQGYPAGFYKAEITLDGEQLSETKFSVDVAQFEDRRLGVSFSYPASWELERPEPFAVQFQSSGGYFVQVDSRMIGPITLDQMVEVWSEGFGGYAEIFSTFVDGEVPGHLFRHQTISEDIESILDSFIKIKGTRLISVLAIAHTDQFSRYETDFNLIMDSLRIDLPSNPEPLGIDMGREELQLAIEERVASITGLPVPVATVVRFITREEFREEIKVESEDQLTMEELELLQGFCVILDLCAASDDLSQSIEDTVAEGVAGTYVYEDKQITTVLDNGTFGVVEWTTFAHEYAHALQDSKYDLANLGPKNASDDQSTAISALIEGSAIVAENLFIESLSEDLQQEIAATIVEALENEDNDDPEAVSETPRIISETFGWAHSEGLDFVSYLYFQDGIGAIDRAFSDLPQSTEQILHPQKYLEGEGPDLVELPDISSAVGNGWAEQEVGTLGELMTGIYLGTFVDQELASSAAEGWGGDLYTLLKDDQDRWMIAMLHSWDSAVEAEEYFRVYVHFVNAKSQGLWESEPDVDGNLMWTGEDGAVYLAVDEDLTLTIVGPDPAAVDAARDAILVP